METTNITANILNIVVDTIVAMPQTIRETYIKNNPIMILQKDFVEGIAYLYIWAKLGCK